MIYVNIRKLEWGWVALAATDRGICLSCLPRKTKIEVAEIVDEALAQSRGWQWSNTHPILVNAWQQLKEYYEGKRTEFDVPLDLTLGTQFQQEVWKVSQDIPAGQTRSYGWVAHCVGRGRAARAVGGAMGANRVPPFVPCHRVVGSSGRLTGFGGGLPLKAKMLELEGVKLKDTRVLQ